MAINIYTVKWGSKYSPQHVNKIYESCLESISDTFTIHCLTENSNGLSEDIKVIPFPKENKLEKWWNMMYLFDDNVVRRGIIICEFISNFFSGNSIGGKSKKGVNRKILNLHTC